MVSNAQKCVALVNILRKTTDADTVHSFFAFAVGVFTAPGQNVSSVTFEVLKKEFTRLRVDCEKRRRAL